MEKSMWIRNRTLEITKGDEDYMLNDKEVNVILHAARLDFKVGKPPEWLYLFSKEGTYIGCIWINSDTDMKNLGKFLKEMRNESND